MRALLSCCASCTRVSRFKPIVREHLADVMTAAEFAHGTNKAEVQSALLL